MTQLSQILARRELLGLLVARNFRIRYKNSSLGFFWSLLTPLFFIAVYAIFAGVLGIRKQMIGVGGEGGVGFLPFLVSGVIIWQFTAMCLGDALSAVVGNANLVKKASFPRLMLPLSMVFANAFNFALTLVVLFIYLLISSNLHLSSMTFLILPAFILQTALCLGLSALFSALNVFFRDVEHIISVALMAWFFMCPVFYPLSMQLDYLASFPEWLVYLNPMTGILGLYRAATLGLPISAAGATASTLVTLALLWIGIAVFRKLEPNFGDEL